MERRLPVAVVLLIAATVSTAAAQGPPDADRIAQWAEMLPAAPRGVGPTIENRKAWNAAAAAPAYRDVVARAEQLLERPIPELTDALFLDFSKTGNRTRCQRVLSQRHGRVTELVLAECIENRGRFLPAIEEAIRAVCAEKTWVLPAHDRSLANFQGKTIEIDLVAAATSWNLATADYWLGGRLGDPTRKLIRDELERRAFQPFAGSVATGKPRLWWLTTTNNWNSVCLAGVTGAALAQIESPNRRAFFAAAAESYVRNLMKGFTDDGYCSEGLGYWNYGFGHYALLAETLGQATGGRANLFAEPKVSRVARFGPRMEVLPGVYPAFADCTVGSRPSVRLTAFLSRRLGLGMADVEREGLLLAQPPTGSLFQVGIYAFNNSATRGAPAPIEAYRPALHDWFDKAGVLIARPAPDRTNALGVALKGGHNAEHHNHNDVGSFVVALAGKTPIVDPGAETYTARTFSSRRYESGVLNSIGHSVPMVAGTPQITGRGASGAVVMAELTDQTVRLTLDIASAYRVEQLETLERAFVFSRIGRGSLSITDRVEFDSPQRFGTALITFDPWRQTTPNRLEIGQGEGAVAVEIDAGGEALEIEAERIEEDVRGGRKPTRLGFDLAEPVERATVTMEITPLYY